MSSETNTETNQSQKNKPQSEEDLEKIYTNNGKYRLQTLKLRAEHNELLRQQVVLLQEQNEIIKVGIVKE